MAAFFFFKGNRLIEYATKKAGVAVAEKEELPA